MHEPKSWDIFCRVVDNFGDAGVCWRLARRLTALGGSVRLWIDDLAPLEKLRPGVDAVVVDQTVDDIRVLDFRHGAVDLAPAEVVIEAFGCGLPAEYADRLGKDGKTPLWIVLEYLSAESWVREHHGLPSPHPRLEVGRFFFFPGFERGTGGLLREPDLFSRRDAFGDRDRRAFWESVGHSPPANDVTTVSLFAYDMAPIDELLEVWERSPAPLVVAVPEGQALACALRHYQLTSLPHERSVRRGALDLRVVPFVSQERYDELLWTCDVNFVRGEDSFVRAQWAGRPFVWHIYPQREHAHWVKLEAFLAAYGDRASVRARSAAVAMMRCWNRLEAAATGLEGAWSEFVSQRHELRLHTRHWADRVAAIGELADNLVSFCREKLK